MQTREYTKKIKLVDPVTGKPSNAPDAIAYHTFRNHKKVDPDTGKPSRADNAIRYSTFYQHRLVEPTTGKRSDAKNAIPYHIYQNNAKELHKACEILVSPPQEKNNKCAQKGVNYQIFEGLTFSHRLRCHPLIQ